MANITVSELYINSKQMPTPAAEGVTITREKIWSEDTGRTADGGMTGTIIAIKTKMSIRWALLTPAQVATIEAAVSDGGHRRDSDQDHVFRHTHLYGLLLGEWLPVHQRCVGGCNRKVR